MEKQFDAPSGLTRLTRWTRWGVTAMIALTLLAHLLPWLPSSRHLVLHSLGGAHGPANRAVGVLNGVLVLLALFQLLPLLGAIGRGALFSANVTVNLRRFALFMLLSVLNLAVVAPALTYFLPDCSSGAPCARIISIDIRSLGMLLMTTLFFLVAGLLDEARRIEEDNEQIV